MENGGKDTFKILFKIKPFFLKARNNALFRKFLRYKKGFCF